MISVSMVTGESVVEGEKEIRPEGESTISDVQALKLWDGIIDSIRIRPGALPMGMTSLGDITPTCRFGDVCPRSGYWMKQVNHLQFRLNAYYATAPVHQPYKEGDVFRPDIIDEPQFQPHTVWTWRRAFNG